jgi:hypothetical protein
MFAPILACITILVAPLSGCGDPEPPDDSTINMPTRPAPAFFTELPATPRALPEVTSLEIDSDMKAGAIRGGLGRDNEGHIWFALCAPAGKDASARLMELDPETNSQTDHGDVVTALKAAKLAKDGTAQSDIRTRIIKASDGHLYFASMNTPSDESKDAPSSGGHLWRLRFPEREWEHLLATPESLVAIGGGRGYIYALGADGHKLYQYTITSGKVRSVNVGSVAGHHSRHIITDSSDHAYVPRVSRDEAGALTAELVQYDTNLAAVGATTLKHYSAGSADASQGITAIQPMADHSIVFATSIGYLYRVLPIGGAKAKVLEVGWLKRDETPRHATGLFTYAGTRYVIVLSSEPPPAEEGKRYEWSIYHVESRIGIAPRLRIDDLDLNNCLLSGSITRDNQGNFYIGGTDQEKNVPLLIKITCPK